MFISTSTIIISSIIIDIISHIPGLNDRGIHSYVACLGQVQDEATTDILQLKGLPW